MNLVENYLEKGYTVKHITIDGKPFVIFDGLVNCYGNITHQHHVWPLEEWKIIKKQGYYMG